LFNDAVRYQSYTEMDMGRWCQDNDRQTPKNSEENLSHRQFFPQQIQHKLAWIIVRISAVCGWCRTVWVMAVGPIYTIMMIALI